MSTLRVNTIQNSGGTGSPAISGLAAAWVNFNGTGTIAIRASSNVSSITDNGTGDYTVNFTTALADANFSVVGMTCAASDGATDTLRGISLWGPTSITTSTARIRTMNGINTGVSDNATNSVAIFR